MRAALVRNGIVENVILASDDFNPGSGLTLVPIGDQAVQIGASYDGETFLPPALPAPVVPREVTRRQARLALLAAGLLETVNAMVASLPGTQGEAIRIEWNDALGYRRDSVLIATLAAQIVLPDGRVGLTSAEIDALFIAAAAYP